MQESAQTCLSFLLARSDDLALDRDEIEKSNIHIHFPDGATPKDGPSAGNAILSALVSLFTKKSIRSDVCMTGEITLRGEVLPVGGIKEKVLAAHRYEKNKIILPASNWFDLEDIPQEVLAKLELYPVRQMEEVLQICNLLKSKKTIKPTRYKKITNKKNHSLEDVLKQRINL